MVDQRQRLGNIGDGHGDNSVSLRLKSRGHSKAGRAASHRHRPGAAARGHGPKPGPRSPKRLRAIVRPQPAGGEHGDYVAGQGRDRDRRGPRHRQGHCGGVREGGRQSARGEPERRGGPGSDGGDRGRWRRGVVPPGRRQEPRRHGAHGGNLHRALRRHRHPLRQRRHLSHLPHRRHVRRDLGRRARHQPQGRLQRDARVHPADEGAGAGAESSSSPRSPAPTWAGPDSRTTWRRRAA